jgi:hypothetical protein
MVRGILFDQAVKDGTLGPLEEPIVMLVQQSSIHCQRVGIFKVGSAASDALPRLVVHLGEPPEHLPYNRFVQRGSDKVFHRPIPGEGKYDVPLRKHSLAAWKEKRWEKFFVEDTIVLG